MLLHSVGPASVRTIRSLIFVASNGRDSKLKEGAKTIATGDEITSAFLILAARRSTLARFILLDIATFARLVTRVKATRHVTQVAIGVSLDILRHVVIWIDFFALIVNWIDFFALISIGHGATPSKENNTWAWEVPRCFRNSATGSLDGRCHPCRLDVRHCGWHPDAQKKKKARRAQWAEAGLFRK
jgi:hypothetical protein